MTTNITPAEYAATVAKIEKINARAEKRGFTGRIEVTGTPFTHTYRNAFGFEVSEQMVEVSIGGEAPSYGGWKFAAVLDWDENANSLITRMAPGADIVVDRDALQIGHCDHCNTDRFRRTTYLVVNEETGEQKQVGSSCIKDFTGHTGRIVFIYEDDIESEVSEGWGSHGGDRSASTLTVLAIAWAATRAFGYQPSSYDGPSTKGHVQTILWARKEKFNREVFEAVSPLIADSYAQAEAVRAFILSDAFSGNSEYVINLKAIAKADFVSARNIGLLASAPQAHARAMEQTLIREREAKFGVDSTHVGAKGDKVEVKATIAGIRYIDGDYGVTVLYTLHGADGNVYKWFASREALGDKQGVEVTIKGTVKAHGEYNGTKDTVLTRCKAL